jgi:hypothetical protein
MKIDDLKYGNWGSDADLAAVAKSGFGDHKTKKMTSLGGGTWKEALTRSPAEPGLSRFIEFPDGRLTSGGWSDLAPTLVLKAIGCEKVIYVQRQGDESTFAIGVAKQDGMTEGDWKSLYDLSNPESSYSLSVEKADGVWCANWDAFGDLQQREKALDAYTAPIETRATFAGISILTPNDRATPRVGKPGCTPGLSAGATFAKP